MKKLITSTLIVILLFLCVVPVSYAASEPATLSEDYQTLTLDGNTYSRSDISQVITDYQPLQDIVSLSSIQQETIKEVTLMANESKVLIYADIYYKDGATFTIGYLQDSFKDEYRNLVNGQTDNYVIDFIYPEENTVTVSPKALYGKQLLLSAKQLNQCDYFPVKAFTDDGSIYVDKGSILIVDDAYYFACFEELDIDRFDFIPYNYKELAVYKITDSETIASIQEGENAYYGEDFGFLLDDDLGTKISSVFLVIVFGIVPFAIFLLFLILAIRSKTVYKKLFRMIYLISGLELVIFAIITWLIVINQ